MENANTSNSFDNQQLQQKIKICKFPWLIISIKFAADFHKLKICLGDSGSRFLGGYPKMIDIPEIVYYRPPISDHHLWAGTGEMALNADEGCPSLRDKLIHPIQ